MSKNFAANTLKISRDKTKANAIALFLVLTIALTLIALPVANAHTPGWSVPTISYIAVTNSVISVNQETTIVFWLNAVPPTAFGGYGDRWIFTVEVTKPDNSKETLGPFTSDPVGGGWTAYTPTQTGIYTLVAKFAEHTVTGNPAPPSGWVSFFVSGVAAYINDTYLASESIPIELIVQEEPIQSWTDTPLPTQYWTRPLNSMNREWYPIVGNWLAGAAQNVGSTTQFAYGTGPESAHVMWATPMWSGGIMDARFGDIGYQTEHYEGLGFSPPIILDGRIFYNVQSLPRIGWYCLDLYTGETLYFHNTTGPVTGVSPDSSGSISGESLAFGQIYNYASPNQYGGMPYLWSTTAPGKLNTWMMFDAYTGNYICSIANVSSSRTVYTSETVLNYDIVPLTGMDVYGKDGSILYYSIVGSGANKRLQVWNTSQAIWRKDWAKINYLMAEYWVWRPGLNVTYDGRNGFSLNASIPDVQGSILAVREDQYVIGGTAGKNNGTYVLQGNLWALNLKPDANGVITPTLLWNITYTPPQQQPDVVYLSLNVHGMTGPYVVPEDGVFLFRDSQTLKWWCYSLETGQLLWEGKPEGQYNFYNAIYVYYYKFYQHMLLSSGWSGELIAYNITTGNVLWTYTAPQIGFESPYGNYPLFSYVVADGKIYLTSAEHSPSQPLWRGSCLICVNVTDGAELWKISNLGVLQGQSMVIADGFLVGLNHYDNQIYCIGKGPSATTVTASPKVSVNGDSVLVEGTVTDQCAGAKALAADMGYVNGVPAMSDESMQAWMEYLYMQQAIPGNATGVEVTLDTLDPNGNFVHIGTATSDISGLYKKAFVPEVPGEYTIIATFAGSESYYGSFAETAINVDEAPQATAEPAYPQPVDNTWTIIGVGIVLLIAIIVVGIWIKKK